MFKNDQRNPDFQNNTHIVTPLGTPLGTPIITQSVNQSVNQSANQNISPGISPNFISSLVRPGISPIISRTSNNISDSQIADSTDVWSEKEVKYLQRLKEYCDKVSYEMEKLYTKFTIQERIITIPSLILTAANSLASFGIDQFKDIKEYIPLSVGISSCVIGILNGVNGYMEISVNRNVCKNGCKELRKLAKEIELELSLDVANRNISGLNFARTCFSKMQAIHGTLPIAKILNYQGAEKTIPKLNLDENTDFLVRKSINNTVVNNNPSNSILEYQNSRTNPSLVNHSLINNSLVPVSTPAATPASTPNGSPRNRNSGFHTVTFSPSDLRLNIQSNEAREGIELIENNIQNKDSREFRQNTNYYW